MNTANLQMAGTLAAIAALADALRRKGLLDGDEIEAAFAAAERALLADPDRPAEVSRSNVEAMVFPLRYLRAANQMAADQGVQAPFTAVASAVGQSKPTSAPRDRAGAPPPAS